MISSYLLFGLIAALAGAAAIFVLSAYQRAADGARVRALPAFGVAAAAAIAALGVYVAIGHPSLEGAPYRGRLEALKGRDINSLNAQEVLAILNERARTNPSEVEPHLYAGEVYLTIGDAEHAAREFDAALRRDAQSAPALLGLGRALVAVEGGLVSADATDAFQKAAAANPADPAPWLYLATGAMQQDHGADAQRFWGEAYQRMSEDDPRREMARRMSRGEAPPAPPEGAADGR